MAVDIDYSIIDKEPLVETSHTKNISAGGICLIIYEKVEIDTLLSLTIKLPEENQPILTKGKVAWTKEFRLNSEQTNSWDAGIEFVNIKDIDRDKISKYIFTLLP